MYSARREVVSDHNCDQYTGFDRFGRVVDQKWSNSTTVPLDRFKYGYDENGNRLYKDVDLGSDTTAWAGFDELYHGDGTVGYDKLNQLQEFQRGTITGGDSITSETRSQVWNPDALGNFETVTENGAGSPPTRYHNRQNQLYQIGDGGSSIGLTYDSAGNLTNDGSTAFTYDAWNRMMKVGGNDRYGYDPLNRRIKEGVKTFFYSNNWQVLEERNSGVVEFRNAWSPVYVDAMIARDEYASGTMTARLYVLVDANFNVTALASTAGVIQQRFVYDPYGAVTYLNASWGSGSAGWVYLHQGGRIDATSGMYHFRFRDSDSELMRWNRNDPKGYCAGDQNLHRVVGNSPLSHVDPMGLERPGNWPTYPNTPPQHIPQPPPPRPADPNVVDVKCQCFVAYDRLWRIENTMVKCIKGQSYYDCCNKACLGLGGVVRTVYQCVESTPNWKAWNYRDAADCADAKAGAVVIAIYGVSLAALRGNPHMAKLAAAATIIFATNFAMWLPICADSQCTKWATV